MFKFSAVSQIWKKYIQKLNDWDLPLNCKIRLISAFQSFVGTQKRAHQDMLVMSGFTRFINFWLVARDLNRC